MEFRLFRPISALCVGFDLITADGTTVFRSYQTDQNRTGVAASDGRETTVAMYNSGEALLNAGRYYISPRISIHNIKWLLTLDSVVQFEMILDHGVSPLWNSLSEKARPGAIAPIFSWTAEREAVRR